jgi:membrane protease subunit HflK
MNRELILLRRGAIHSLTGLGVQIVLVGILVWLVRAASVGNASHFLWAACAGLIVWFHLIQTYLQLKREKGHSDQTEHADLSPNGTKASTGGSHRIHLSHTIYDRFLVPVLELGAAALLFQSLRLLLNGKPAMTPPVVVGDLLLIAIHSIGTLVLIVFTVYLTHLMRVNAWQRIKCARNLTGLMVAMLIGLLVGACSRHLGIPGVDTAVGWVFIFINCLLGSEILFSMVLRWFTPRHPTALFRPAFDFYLLEGLSRPMQSGFVFAGMLENIFGFDITRTAFGKRTQSLLIPAALLVALLLLGFSTIVIVRPHEQAIVMTLGRLQTQALGPGLHFKSPWPVGTARHYAAATIRSIHVGSHRSSDGRRSVYREGVPILWTNLHGISMDELLICSSPQDRTDGRINDTQRSGSSHKVPSVSLAAADVHVQFIIHDVLAYVRASAQPERLLQRLAEACASRFIYRYDIDGLFCDARLDAVDSLKDAIQSACNACDLGIRIVHVAISGVHPPVHVADAFEETVAAMQERETRVQEARQAAVRIQTETTGETNRFVQLATLADGDGSAQDIDGTEQNQLLNRCGGAVSQVLAEAGAYRFSRENVERGKTERFGKQLQAFQASPRNYRFDHYFSVLEKGLAKSRKIVLMGNTRKTMMRMGIGEGLNITDLPDDSDY